MSPEIKNGKLHTINIYRTTNIYIAIISILLSFFLISVTPAHAQEKQWVIVIDPGHGGRDPGSIGSFVKEKNINLAVALKTGKYLQENVKNIKVVYTRDDDSTVDLLERPRIANRNNADLFISIHSNWWKVKSVSGAETYIMGTAKDDQNLAVAMKENEVMLLEDNYSVKYGEFDPKSPESYIMFTLMQNVFQKQSTELAQKIQTQFTEKVERKDRGVKQAGFWVLFNTTMPSVLVETGFISNPPEEKFLSTAQGQDYIAAAIYRACREYIEEINNRSVSLNKLKNDTVNTKTEKKPLPGASPTGLIEFTVQISASASKTPVSPSNFKGLNNVFEISSQDRFKYASGKFTEYSEAVKHRKDIKKIYPDAFVIALMDNNIIPLQQAINQKKDNNYKK